MNGEHGVARSASEARIGDEGLEEGATTLLRRRL